MASDCLSEDQIRSLQDAPPGQLPPELAAHLASCERCQSRALFGAARRTGLARAAPPTPSLGRALVLLAIVGLAMAAFFWTLSRMTGR